LDEVILRDLRENYGLQPTEIAPVDGGWMNKKWKIKTPEGVFLVKQFSRERFNERQLGQIEDALTRQMILYGAGVPCPRIFPCGGRPIRRTADGTVYMVMDFAPGYTVTPETVTETQLCSLGEAAARMHDAFAHLPTEGIRRYPENGAALLDQLQRTHSARREALHDGSPDAYRRAIMTQEAILRTLSAEYPDALPRAIAHEDFSPDNMLFTESGISAILDFDRNQYSYPLHDIGRVLLSLCLHHGTLCGERIDAFCRGYAEHRPLSAEDLADALRITWCIETIWWIREDFFTGGKAKIIRFRDEILWVGEHWHELREAVSGEKTKEIRHIFG